jgi:hypothetical protein
MWSTERIINEITNKVFNLQAVRIPKNRQLILALGLEEKTWGSNTKKDQ